MAKDSNGNGLAYKGDEGSYSVYEMWLGNRVVFEASIDNNDPNLMIYVGKPGATFGKVHDLGISAELIETKGRAQIGMHEMAPAEGELVPEGIKKHIDGMSVQLFVYSTLPFLMADIYVPVELTLPDEPKTGDVES